MAGAWATLPAPGPEQVGDPVAAVVEGVGLWSTEPGRRGRGQWDPGGGSPGRRGQHWGQG